MLSILVLINYKVSNFKFGCSKAISIVFSIELAALYSLLYLVKAEFPSLLPLTVFSDRTITP